MGKSPYDIILAPVVTEKATDLQRKSVYMFKVPLSATKIEIRRAVEELFDVKVEKVRTLRTKPRIRRWRGRVVGKTSPWKKAIVKLKEGYTIDELGV